MTVKFVNFFTSKIADVGGIGSGDTEFTLSAGDGSDLPTLTGGHHCYLTLVDVSSNREVVKVTGVASDTCTIVRGQDGTTPRAFAQNDLVELRLTKGALEDIQADVATNTSDIATNTADVATVLAATVANALIGLGLVRRPKFTWKDADEIHLSAGVYEHRGTSNQFVYWSSQLTIPLAGASNSAVYYLYLDDSAIVSAGTNLLTASEFLFSTTKPTWSESKHGQYNGEDRCIFAVKTDGSGDIEEFFHDGGDYVSLADYVQDLTITDIDDIWTEVTVSAPGFSTKAKVNFHINYYTANWTYWRTKGQTGTYGHIIAFDGSAPNQHNVAVTVFMDNSQKIELKHTSSAACSVLMSTDGWYLPIGM